MTTVEQKIWTLPEGCIPPQGTLHLRFNDLMPPDADYASAFESNAPIVGHARLDSALLSTVAFPVMEYRG